MKLLAEILMGLVGLLHVYFLVLEMFLWTKPAGLKAFGQTLAQARASATLAANQGLYNGFLAAGLVWALFERNSALFHPLAYFFLACVSVAGLYGAYSVSRKIFFVQALPAIIALALLFVSYS